jgi:condensin complex subunit 1
LTNLLEHNPFGGNLDPQAYRVKLKELYTFVQTNLPSHIREAQEMACAEAQDDEQALHEIEAATLSTVLAEFAEDGTTSEDVEVSEEFRTKIQATRFTQSALDFIDAVEGATSALDGMLLSANTSDVTEALRFFVQARHFALPCAVTGMKRALALMWSTEVAIRDEVLKAFVEVFIAQPGSEGATFMSDHQIAKNLMVLTAQATVSELASIEEALGRLVREERIPADVFLILWSIASKGSGEARTVALQLIAMGAAADRSLVDSKSRLKLLLDASLGDYMQEHHDWALAAAGATVLQRVSRGKVDPTDAKYLVLERTMTELCAVARGDICRDESEADTRRWFSASEQAIKALFVLSPHPETDCAEIVRGMQASVFGTDSCPTLRLARFFHVLGQTALHLLVYTESLSAGVRRGNAKRALYKQESADKAKAQSQGNADADDAMEAELGMAAELEAENERQIADISENEILGRGLISAFGPLLVRVVGNEGNKFESEILRQSSTLALCKFMCVSSTFCEQHLPLLFTALSNAPSEDITMRANTVVALGDLAFRFPNEVEPYTPRIYSCLRDPSTKVRRHTMMVLTHLILNDMVKVKGNVCEIALCLRDEDPRIRDTARLLFHELSKRSNNPVYNLLPDIVSQLSQRPNARDDFRSIMSFLLGYIKKERQNDMLMEKFLQRFEKCSTVSQKADLAYCLTLLKVSEKSIKYLSENFKLYKDALFDADVRKSFSGIVTKAKKALKPELRQFVEEWEAQLNEMATAGAENEEADAQAGKALAKARRRANRKQGGQLVAIVEDNVVEEEESTEVTNATPSPRKQRASRKISPVLEEESSGDDMEFDDSNSVEMESLEQPPQSTRKPSRRVIAD